MLKTKKHSLCKYMKLEEIEEGLEVAIFPDLTLDEKNFAFMLLGSFLSSNRLQVVGINITVPW
jgi:hypothetical protein